MKAKHPGYSQMVGEVFEMIEESKLDTWAACVNISAKYSLNQNQGMQLLQEVSESEIEVCEKKQEADLAVG